MAVSGLLAHSPSAVTVKYDRRGEPATERLASRLYVPYYEQAVDDGATP